MEGNPLAVAIRELLVAFVNRGWPVQFTNGVIALAGKRPAHDLEPGRPSCDFAAVFEFVAFADRGFHRCICTAV